MLGVNCVAGFWWLGLIWGFVGALSGTWVGWLIVVLVGWCVVGFALIWYCWLVLYYLICCLNVEGGLSMIWLRGSGF